MYISGTRLRVVSNNLLYMGVDAIKGEEIEVVCRVNDYYNVKRANGEVLPVLESVLDTHCEVTESYLQELQDEADKVGQETFQDILEICEELKLGCSCEVKGLSYKFLDSKENKVFEKLMEAQNNKLRALDSCIGVIKTLMEDR